MAQLVGSRVGTFEVLSSLGAGGMGEVYRARDTRLGREVALKILPARFAHDADRLSRFKREAHVLASLNHTNIAVLYDVEELDGAQALVMEFVDGETLAGRLARGALSVRDVVAAGMQIVDGLEAAHERGVIHRDLKPSNIVVRDDGVVKILDFGLAKALDASSLSTTSSDRTMTSPATQVGVVVGTPAYMSPEQIEGRAADTRSDIWAFGCVLYEMLAGKPAFGGETTTETLSAVMIREPDWAALPAGTPAPLAKLARWCLEKDRKRRLAHIADARAEMSEGLASKESAADAHPATRRREVFAWAIAASLLAALVAGAVYLRGARPTPDMVRFTMLVPQSARDPRIALSPDGKSLVFVAPGPTKEDVLWIRRLDELEGKPVSGTEGAASPFWSPDSRSVGFFTQSRLRRVPAAGGTVQTLVDGLRPQLGGVAGAWNANDVIVFAQVFGPLQAIPAAGGSPRPVTKVLDERKEFGHYNPVFLPDGEHLMYDVGASLLENSGVYSSSLTSTEKTRIIAKRVSPFVVTSRGFMLFVDDGLLKAQRLDLQQRQLIGSSVPLADNVSALSVSTNGTLAYRTAVAARTQLRWVDRKGTALGTVGRPGRYDVLALSPDETRVAFARDGDIWVLDLTRGNETRLTSDPGFDGFPTWSANGNDILYSHGVAGGGAMGGTLLRRPASGAGAEEVLLQQSLLYPVETSADGRFLTYFAPGPTESLDLLVLPLAGDRKPLVFLDSRFQETSNRLSPDGKWMAYVSDETGQQEVYVQTFPRSDQRWKISDGGGLQPIWRRDGRELFFLGKNSTLMAVDVKTTNAFAPGTPQPLFSAEVEPGPGSRVIYAPARDGQRFLVNAAVDGAGSPIVVVLNWSRDLTEP